MSSNTNHLYRGSSSFTPNTHFTQMFKHLDNFSRQNLQPHLQSYLQRFYNLSNYNKQKTNLFTFYFRPEEREEGHLRLDVIWAWDRSRCKEVILPPKFIIWISNLTCFSRQNLDQNDQYLTTFYLWQIFMISRPFSSEFWPKIIQCTIRMFYF